MIFRHLTHYGRDKTFVILQTTFWSWLSSLKINLFDWMFNDICSQLSSWQYASISSGNGLSPIRQQTFIWANDCLVFWRIHTSLGLRGYRGNVHMNRILQCRIPIYGNPLKNKLFAADGVMTYYRILSVECDWHNPKCRVHVHLISCVSSYMLWLYSVASTVIIYIYIYIYYTYCSLF